MLIGPTEFGVQSAGASGEIFSHVLASISTITPTCVSLLCRPCHQVIRLVRVTPTDSGVQSPTSPAADDDRRRRAMVIAPGVALFAH